MTSPTSICEHNSAESPLPRGGEGPKGGGESPVEYINSYVVPSAGAMSTNPYRLPSLDFSRKTSNNRY